MEFNRTTIEDIFFHYKKCAPWILVFVAISFGISYLFLEIGITKTTGFSIVNLVQLALTAFWIMLAYRAHASVLGTERSTYDHLLWSVRFIFRFIIVSIICLLPILIFYIGSFTAIPAAREALFAGQSVLFRFDFASFFGMFALLAMISTVGLMAVLGTYLPAYVDQKHLGLKAALERGKRQWWFVLWRSMILFVVGIILMIILLFLATSLVRYNLPIQNNDLAKLQETFATINLWISIPLHLIYAYFCVAIPVILSRAYLRDVYRHGEKIQEVF